MRVVIEGVGNYKCDWCKRNFTAEQAPHLSIEIGPRSGWATPRSYLPGWRFSRLLKPGRRHFCGPACLAGWLEVIADTAAPEYVEA